MQSKWSQNRTSSLKSSWCVGLAREINHCIHPPIPVMHSIFLNSHPPNNRKSELVLTRRSVLPHWQYSFYLCIQVTFVASPQAFWTASPVATAVVASPAGAVAVAAVLASNDEASAFNRRIRPITSHHPVAAIFQNK